MKTQEEKDIAAANKAWNDEDVSSSYEAVLNHHDPDPEAIRTPNMFQAANPTLALVEIDKGIRKFWTKRGPRFCAVWRGMTPLARGRLLRTVAPEMARTRSDPESEGQLLLLSEFVVDELSQDGNKLISVIEEKVVGEELNVQYFQDTQLIRHLIRLQKLSPEMSKRNSFAFLHGRSHVGQIVKVKTDRLAEIGGDLESQFSEMIERGYVVEGPVFYYVILRRQHLLFTVASLFDEMRTSVFREDKSIAVRAMQCSFPGCDRTKFVSENGNREKPLQSCSRCHMAMYCSREHQKAHWREHKKVCGKTP